MTRTLQRALVTGADGFLGRHLVRELEHYGMHVTCLTRKRSSSSSSTRGVAMGDAPWSFDFLTEVIRHAEPDIVFHLAGGNNGTAAQLETLNVGLACSVMEALRRTDTRPVFVCCGSAAEYGHAVIDGVPTPETALCAPVTPYGASKLAQTQAALAFGAATGNRVVIARIFNPIGPGMPPHLALGGFAQQLAALPPHGGVLRTGTLDVARDFIDIELVARALRLLATTAEANGVVNVCSGQATRLSDLVEMLIAHSGKAVRPELAFERVRPDEIRTIYGDPNLLWRLVSRLPNTNYNEVMKRLWQKADIRITENLQWMA